MLEELSHLARDIESLRREYALWLRVVMLTLFHHRPAQLVLRIVYEEHGGRQELKDGFELGDSKLTLSAAEAANEVQKKQWTT